ncbi:MAG: HAD-IA family hydrolase [Bryobacteraceae bacterium]
MRLLIFDLDGTLIDSRRDLIQAVNATRVHYRLGPLPSEVIYSYVGNGAPVLIRRVLGPEASYAQVAEALEYFIRYYRDHALDFTVLYPGVREALDRLRDTGSILAVLTNKPVRISQTIIDGLGIGGYFARVYGGNSFERKKPDPIGIETLMGECGAGREKTIMVGDSSVDVETARNAGVMACGVTYGFQPETFEASPPDLLCNTLEEFADWVIHSGNGDGQPEAVPR